MSEEVNAVLNSPWVRLLLFVLAIVGPLLAFFYHRRGRKEKLPRYDLRSNNLVQDLTARYEPLQVTYNCQQVQNLTATRVILWNAGRETIRNENVPTGDPIVIRPRGKCEILEARKVKENKPANNFRVFKMDDGSGVKCEFEYIDKGQGVVIQLIHTGKGNDDLEITGTVMGASSDGKLVRKRIDVAAEEATMGMLLRLAFSIFGCLAILISYAFLAYLTVIPFRWSEIQSYIAILIVVVLIAPAFLLIINAGNLRAGLPKDLKEFSQEF